MGPMRALYRVGAYERQMSGAATCVVHKGHALLMCVTVTSHAAKGTHCRCMHRKSYACKLA